MSNHNVRNYNTSDNPVNIAGLQINCLYVPACDANCLTCTTTATNCATCPPGEFVDTDFTCSGEFSNCDL